MDVSTAVVPSAAPPTPHLESHCMTIPKSTSDHALSDDRFHGHRLIAETAERFLMNLFACSQDSVSATIETKPEGTLRLSYFIAYALYRTRLPMTVMYSALCLLKRLKTRYPVARGSSGHRLFISAFMLSCKMICDDSYNNKSWVIVGQNMFTLHEINQMERELFSYLDFQLKVEPEELAAFAAELEWYGAPALTLDDLKRTRIVAPTSVTASRSAPKSMSGTASSSIASSSSSSSARRKTHRRCLSLRPDYWNNPHSTVSNASVRHYRSESNEWCASGMQRTSRQHARSSMPLQRSAPMYPYPQAAPLHTPSFTAVRPDTIISPGMSWSPFYTAANASSLSSTTPISATDSLRPTPSTSMSDLSLCSPNQVFNGASHGVPMFLPWEPAKPMHVPSYEVNESFRMPPLPSTMAATMSQVTPHQAPSS
ncbi:cyclin-dependent protein serine/threonine kinase regulator [Malassezia pachydermatis]